MKNICDELFYDVLPLRKQNPRYGLDAMCRKAVKNVVRQKLHNSDTIKAEKKLRNCRDYALDNYKQL